MITAEKMDSVRKRLHGVRRTLRSLYLAEGIARVLLTLVAFLLLTFALDFLLDLPVEVRLVLRGNRAQRRPCRSDSLTSADLSHYTGKGRVIFAPGADGRRRASCVAVLELGLGLADVPGLRPLRAIDDLEFDRLTLL